MAQSDLPVKGNTVREGVSPPEPRATKRDSRASLDRPTSTQFPNFARQLRLLDHAGAFLSFVSPQKAIELTHRCGALLHQHRGKFRSVQLIREPDSDHGTARMKRPKDVHNHETWYNPRGVWTFRKAA